MKLLIYIGLDGKVNLFKNIIFIRIETMFYFPFSFSILRKLIFLL